MQLRSWFRPWWGQPFVESVDSVPGENFIRHQTHQESHVNPPAERLLLHGDSKRQGQCGLKGSFRLFLLTSPPHPRQKRISIRSCDTFICITIHAAPSIFRRRARQGYFAYEFPIRRYTALKGIFEDTSADFLLFGGHTKEHVWMRLNFLPDERQTHKHVHTYTHRNVWYSTPSSASA